ncbi:MAG: tRNA (adenosine(37)-N6)-dimethylallyltransferase MiaA [Planctomycetota bacterium]|nr:tRNA (adenosine(37)-N6)-dimethylallyltransferase MiaA [Planctomycetota bacterium]
MNVVRILCGPTACGKSAVVLYLAQKLGAEVLSIDSMKIYRGLDIGTAKPAPGVLARTAHHLISIREPWESFSVAEFLRAAEAVIADCAARRVPLIGDGGTALYLKALSEGLFAGPGRDMKLRAALEAEAAESGVPKLHERLAKIDPDAARKILPSDLRRTVRALEVHVLTGVPISRWQSQWGMPRSDLDVRLACLRLPRAVLYERIDRRVDAMLAAGWLDECRRLLALPHPLSREALQALGYSTLFKHLRGEMSFEAARERICFDTHHFARRQLGWFRRLPKLAFVDVAPDEIPDRIAERVLAAWEGARQATEDTERQRRMNDEG